MGDKHEIADTSRSLDEFTGRGLHLNLDVSVVTLSEIYCYVKNGRAESKAQSCSCLCVGCHEKAHERPLVRTRHLEAPEQRAGETLEL